jgi:hypothetical protein
VRATVIYGAGDVRVENVPDAALREPTDAVVRAPARAYIEELLPDILQGRIEPGRVFDRTVTLDDVPAGYQAMADRQALKVIIQP